MGGHGREDSAPKREGEAKALYSPEEVWVAELWLHQSPLLPQNLRVRYKQTPVSLQWQWWGTVVPPQEDGTDGPAQRTVQGAKGPREGGVQHFLGVGFRPAAGHGEGGSLGEPASLSHAVPITCHASSALSALVPVPLKTLAFLL